MNFTSSQGEKVLITAGPTYEHLDPVRYIGNHSSGKMGFAIAKAALTKGYLVELITGPTSEELIHPNLTRCDVVSANEMMLKVKEKWLSVADDLQTLTDYVINADFTAYSLDTDNGNVRGYYIKIPKIKKKKIEDVNDDN